VNTAIKYLRLVTQTGRWPACFSNLFPEGHNRERLARQRGCSVDDEIELLAAAGHDLTILNRYSARPAQDVQEFVHRFVAFVVLGNTDARLQTFSWVELAQLLQHAGVARVGAHVRKAQALIGKMREYWPA
jgi:hypothetical protein